MTKFGPYKCPDLHDFKLLGDPNINKQGSNINMVLNFCTVHAAAFNTTSDGCETD